MSAGFGGREHGFDPWSCWCLGSSPGYHLLGEAVPTHHLPLEPVEGVCCGVAPVRPLGKRPHLSGGVQLTHK